MSELYGFKSDGCRAEVPAKSDFDSRLISIIETSAKTASYGGTVGCELSLTLPTNCFVEFYGADTTSRTYLKNNFSSISISSNTIYLWFSGSSTGTTLNLIAKITPLQDGGQILYAHI